MRDEALPRRREISMERPIRALGEIALRVRDLDKMQKFYSDVIGLELMRRFDDCAFLKIAEGYAGHTQILALFDRSDTPDYAEPRAANTTIDHVAFAVGLEDFERERERLQGLGLEVRTA